MFALKSEYSHNSRWAYAEHGTSTDAFLYRAGVLRGGSVSRVTASSRLDRVRFSGGALLCFVAIFVFARRSKPVERPSTSTPSQAGVRLFALFLIIAVSLSGPWWLSYTGVHLAFPQLVVTSLITCAIGVAIWLIAWHRAKRKA
jgi:hypothetical protein